MDRRISDILDLAIQREEEAYDFYMDIYGYVEDQSVKDTLEFIAGEEKKHKAFLVNYREGNYGVSGCLFDCGSPREQVASILYGARRPARRG
jgi:ferritin